MPVRVTVEARDPKRKSEAHHLALEAGATLANGPVAEDEVRIVLLQASAELWDNTSRRHGMRIGFQGIDLRIGAGNLSHRQPLAKSLGPNCGHIFDATGGFGHDAALLACMGWNVTCVERIDALAAVLGLAIRESNRSAAHAQALEGRMAVMHGDAKEVIQRRVVDADVIYIDPMFEPRKGSALPKKPAQLLHRFAGQDLDAPALLQVAREACHRVIVKRPNDGPVLAPDPPLTFGSRLVRYDVYLQTDKRSIQ